VVVVSSEFEIFSSVLLLPSNCVFFGSLSQATLFNPDDLLIYQAEFPLPSVSALPSS